MSLVVVIFCGDSFVTKVVKLGHKKVLMVSGLSNLDIRLLICEGVWLLYSNLGVGANNNAKKKRFYLAIVFLDRSETK